MVVAALLAVVIGQALLANGQVRLSALQHQLTLEQSAHRQAELAVSQLETPARIVAAASGQLQMVRPASIVELPYVSLSAPLPTPKVTPAPAPTPTTSSAGAGAPAGAGTSGSSSSSAATTTPTSTP
jgi:type II secretory pathway pseudopilin PulG